MHFGHRTFSLARRLGGRLPGAGALARLSLRAKVLLLQIGIVLLVVALMCGMSIAILTRMVEEQYGERVLGVAHAVALMPSIREAFDDPDPSASIQPIAEAVRQRAGLAFVVVANRDRIRYSHPNPDQIGLPLSTDPGSALEGEPYVAIERGTLGDSIRAKAPIYGDDGQVIGLVSVGFLVDIMEDLLSRYWEQIAAVAALSLALGVASSYLLTGHVKRQILGLEPMEIAALFEQREAMLHGIREGVIAVDQQGAITLVNDEALRLLGLQGDPVGRPVQDVLPGSRLLQVLRSGQAEPDQVTVANGRVILVSRIPVRSRGQLVGAIATLRDQTEMQELMQELDGTRSHLDSLRAQSHEFANKLHTIAGLIELSWHEEAVSFIHQVTRQQQELLDRLPRQIADPALAALLVGKSSVASERGIAFTVSVWGQIRPEAAASEELVTIVGNLIENAFDAVAAAAERSVRVELRQVGRQITVEVRDSGPGVPVEAMGRLFEPGFSTKPKGRGHHGVGLALVKGAVRRLNGDVSVRNEDGAVFTVCLPCGLLGEVSTGSSSLPVS